MKLKVSVPASTANIGPGFDVWGMSLDIRNTFYCEMGPEIHENSFEMELDGLVRETLTTTQEHLESGMKSNDNLVLKSFQTVYNKKGLMIPAVKLRAELGIPLSRGLGSSSTAILGGAIIANESIRKTYGSAFSSSELFQIAVELEGHPDNLAAAMFGGWQLCVQDPASQIWMTRLLSLKAPVKLAGVIPKLMLNTSDARKVLEKTFPRDTLGFQSSRTALMVSLLNSSAWNQDEMDLMSLALQDRVHQDKRATLIPGMKEAMDSWMSQGALGVFLSGAGPTILGFWQKSVDFSTLDLTSAMQKAGTESRPFFPEIDQLGAIVEYIV